MNTAPLDLWPWIVLAGLGAFHGLNPAMGWLFAVALGLQRRSRSIVHLSLVPIALGHAAAIGMVLLAILVFGSVLDTKHLGRGAGAVLIGWVVWHAFIGHRRRPIVGMQTELTGLALWSFLMATSHGAGLMLAPAMLALCSSPGMGDGLTVSGSLPTALTALAVHTGMMLIVLWIVALVVYEWVGLALLRRNWINFDWLWNSALVATGAILLVR